MINCYYCIKINCYYCNY